MVNKYIAAGLSLIAGSVALAGGAEAGSKKAAPSQAPVAKNQVRQKTHAVIRLTESENRRCQELAAMPAKEYQAMWPAYFHGKLDETTSKCMTALWKGSKNGKDGKGSNIVVEIIPDFSTEIEPVRESQRKFNTFVTIGVIHAGEHTAPYLEGGLEIERKVNDRGTSVVVGAKAGTALRDSNSVTQSWASGVKDWDYHADYTMTDAQLAMVFAAVQQKAGPVTFRLGGQFGYLHTVETVNHVGATNSVTGDSVKYGSESNSKVERNGLAAGVIGGASLDLGEFTHREGLEGVNIGAEGTANWMVAGQNDYEMHGKGDRPVFTLGARLTIPLEKVFGGWGGKDEIEPLK